jgi:hypothetical protein
MTVNEIGVFLLTVQSLRLNPKKKSSAFDGHKSKRIWLPKISLTYLKADNSKNIKKEYSKSINIPRRKYV